MSELNREAFSTILNADQADLFWAPRSVGSSLQANVPHPRPRRSSQRYTIPLILILLLALNHPTTTILTKPPPLNSPQTKTTNLNPPLTMIPYPTKIPIPIPSLIQFLLLTLTKFHNLILTSTSIQLPAFKPPTAKA